MAGVAFANPDWNSQLNLKCPGQAWDASAVFRMKDSGGHIVVLLATPRAARQSRLPRRYSFVAYAD
jgi:hypothetical protein